MQLSSLKFPVADSAGLPLCESLSHTGHRLVLQELRCETLLLHELDPKGIPQFGLVAEDVEKVNPDLVARDERGKPYTVRYEAVNAMLLNEFLKEHRKTEKLEATVVRQQKQIDALTAGLQKVSAQLELSKPAPQTVLNND